MSENNLITAGNPVPALTAADVFRAKATAAGLSPEAIAATLSRHGYKAPTAPNETPERGIGDNSGEAAPVVRQSTTHGTLNALKQPSLSEAETAQAIKTLLAAGVPQSEIDRALSSSPQPTSDERSPEEAGFDKAFGPPASPAEYKIQYGERAANVDAENLVALDGELRQAMFDLHASPHVANAVVGAFLDSADAWDAATDKGMNENAATLFGREQHFQLGQLAEKPYGGVDNAILWASEALSAMDAETRATLFENRSFETAEAVMRLAELGLNLYVRQELAERRKGAKP